MIDLAIGVISGGAFGKITPSLVNDVLMPLFSLLLGKVDFSNFCINLNGGSYASLSQAQEAEAVTINYGQFLNTIIDFPIIALVVFPVIRQLNWLQEPQGKPAASLAKEYPYCFSFIPGKATRCPACTSYLE